MEEEGITGDTLVNYVSGQILSGPDDAIWDDIFDWIANAVSAVTRTVTDWVDWAKSAITFTVTSWISWLWNNITSWFSSVFSRLIAVRDYIVGWVTTQVREVWNWIVIETTRLGSQIYGWLQEAKTDIWGWLQTNQEMLTNLTLLIPGIGLIVRGYLFATEKTILGHHDETAAGIKTWIGDNIKQPIIAWWDDFMGNLGGILNTWWETIWSWIKTAWENIVHFFSHDLVDGIMRGLGWLTGLVRPIISNALDMVMGLLRSIAPISPEGGTGAMSGLANIGIVMGGGLAAMTVAGHLIHPIKTLGLGQVSAMIYDMTNYKLILGAFMGAVAATAIRTPITYYLNSLLRPWLLRQADFMELMSRGAFTEPEKLRVPELTETVRAVTGGSGAGFENRMIGYYGFPAAYYGFFKELSFAPLRYFPLAGIARTGFYDEAWFTEALSRSGYSPTAKEALLAMYREMVITTRQAPVLYQVTRLSREGFATLNEIKAHLEKAAKLETLTDCRLFAMELEQEFARKEMVFDIIMRAFSRGIVPESETSQALVGLGLPGDMVDLHLMREKLGLVRRITIPAEAAAPPIIGVEE